MLYYKYSDYLKNKYGEKVYKLPVNLPVTCPNRLDGDGCAFCAGAGTGFEAMSAAVSVTEQLSDRGYQDSGCRGDICFHKTGLCFG